MKAPSLEVHAMNRPLRSISAMAVDAPKRPKKRTLREHAETNLAAYKGFCTKKRRCALMSAVLSVAKEDDKPIGVYEGFSFSATGKPAGTEIVYFVRRGQYAVLNHCPFCGEKLQ